MLCVDVVVHMKSLPIVASAKVVGFVEYVALTTKFPQSLLYEEPETLSNHRLVDADADTNIEVSIAG